MSSIFREDRRIFEMGMAGADVALFFENLKNNPGIVTYRESQDKLTKRIMEAIRNNEILLMQAGVGIGKTFGYLIPIFYTYENVTDFKKVIISTSSIALQEQLINDIKLLSSLLGIDIKYSIAKGMNNYACLARIDNIRYKAGVDPETSEFFSNIRNWIVRVKSSDRADLYEVSDEVWKKIQLRNRGACSGCSYSNRCPYYKQLEELAFSQIIVTNHANMVYNKVRQTELVNGVDFVIYDEAHKLPETIRGIGERTLELDDIKAIITTINTILKHHYQTTSVLFENLDKLFSRIMSSASRNFFETQKKMGCLENENAYSVTDNGRIGFWLTPTVINHLDIVLVELKNLIKEVRETNIRIDDRIVKKLLRIYNAFFDLRKGSESNNVFWASYYQKNRINISYIPKNISAVSELLFSKDTANILLSGTMDGYNNYNIIRNELCLDALPDRRLASVTPFCSPYNYQENTLLYYSTSKGRPSKNDEYIRELALEVSELIRATGGKSLVLFTSKKTMNDVYNLLVNENFGFELLLQTDSNATDVKERFTEDINSCLFATGAFWEGIDIKGPSLSNVIITQLPFETFDAVNQYLSRNYVDKDTTIHIPKMVMKLTQGVGRLIRSDNDTGVVCCLDSRIVDYLDEIKKSISFPITSDKKQFYNFVDSKILRISNNYTKKLD